MTTSLLHLHDLALNGNHSFSTEKLTGKYFYFISEKKNEVQKIIYHCLKERFKAKLKRSLGI